MTQPLRKTDGELLAQFSADHSQSAFTELVNRHGMMVHGVALRVLADHHEAQDVMQAVFLALARKASALRRSESVGGWLHTVAWRAAMDVQRSRRNRQQREATVMREQPAVVAANPAAGLFRAELDAALDDLPERYRQPVVLFHLEGRSLEETSQATGLNLNTVSTRLSRARELLRKKLVRRGVTVGSVGALTALLSAESGAAVLPPTLVASTVSAATGGAVSTTVAALSKGALHMLFIAQVKTVSLAAAACLVVAGTGVVVAQRATPAPPAAPAQVGVPPSGGAVTTSPSTPPKGGTPTAPATVAADYKPGKLTAGVIVGVTDGKRLFRVKLDQAFNDLAEISVSCCSPPAVILLDGQPATFEAAVVAGRRVEFEHVRGPTPYLSVRSAAEAPLRFTEADNGKTVTVKVGQEFEVVLRSNRKLTGWEGGGPSAPCVVRLINENGFRYRAVEPGSCAIGFHLVYPSGPGVETRRRTQLLGEFKLTVEVIADGAPATPRAASLATTQPIRLANGLELVAFGPSQANAPTRTRPTPLTLGVRVTNPTAQPREFWPHKVQLLLRWGHGELRTVGVNQNGTPRVRAVAIPAGGTQSFPLAGAHIGYIGKPQYLAFYSETLLGNQYYEQINGEADQIGLAFEYEQDQPSPRTGEIVCRLVAGAAEAASVVNEHVAQQTAQLWVTAFLQGRNDQLAALAETPFCLFNEQVGTAEELATKLAKASQDAKRWSELFTAGKLRLEKVTLLKGEAAAFTAGRSFKKLANPGNVAFLRVRLLIELENERGGVDFGVAIQPANHRVVGFGND